MIYSQECHEEVLVFDQGYWQKNKELYQNIQKSNWEDVILGKERKKAIISKLFFSIAQKHVILFERQGSGGHVLQGNTM